MSGETNVSKELDALAKQHALRLLANAGSGIPVGTPRPKRNDAFKRAIEMSRKIAEIRQAGHPPYLEAALIADLGPYKSRGHGKKHRRPHGVNAKAMARMRRQKNAVPFRW